MIDLQQVEYRYSQSDAPCLQGISVQIEAGRPVSIMGANGSGKSTLARCMNGLLLPSSGFVAVDGLRSDREKDNEEIRRRVGMVFQNPDNQIVTTTVEREVAFGLENLNIPREEMMIRVEQLLAEFDLERYRRHPPHLLSGGEKQLLALVAVLAMQPTYLILDEPTSLLDPYSRNKILKAIFSPKNGRFANLTPILITQFPEETFYTERLLILHQGRLLFDAPPEEVFQHAGDLLRLGVSVPVEFQLKSWNGRTS